MMENQLKKMTDKLKEIRVTGSAGAGMVEATVNGLGVVEKVEINDCLFSPENKGMIETLIVSAVNAALTKAQEEKTDKILNGIEALQTK